MATTAPTEDKPARKPRVAKTSMPESNVVPIQTSNNVGAISQVIGAVVDVTFEDQLDRKSVV